MARSLLLLLLLEAKSNAGMGALRPIATRIAEIKNAKRIMVIGNSRRWVFRDLADRM